MNNNSTSNNYKDTIVDIPVSSSCSIREKSNVTRSADSSSSCRNIAKTSVTTHERGKMKGLVPSTMKKPKIEVVMEPSMEGIDRKGTQVLSGSHQLQQPEQEQQTSHALKLQPPSLISRYTCVSILIGICCIWGKYVFISESDVPDGVTVQIHSGLIPFTLTLLYVISLPLLHTLVKHYNIHNKVDVKLMLRESMIIYNAIQVVLNGWMVYRILYALIWKDHPFIAGPIHLVDTGAAYAVYVHYCDKYLEFLDTYFMILRGKMDQVCRRMLSSAITPCFPGTIVSTFMMLSSSFSSGKGFILTCVSSHINRLCMVDWIEVTSWWRHILRCIDQLLDSCDDVLVLYP
jgi:hypothetical protein